MNPALLGGRYRVEEELGRGAMACVCRATDLRLGRSVAVKILDKADVFGPTTLKRFEREARTVASLSHPNIVGVWDTGSEAGVPYLVLELVDGDSLATRLADGPLSVPEAVRIAVQLCEGLAAAHAAGVVHRDIKPANILLTPTGVAKICDFGIARLRQTDVTEEALTAAGMIIGSSDYLAPEQATGRQVDGLTDLYALGAVLYAMVSGGPPFTADTPLGVVHQHVTTVPPPLSAAVPGVPAALEDLVAGLLAKDPAARPATAGEVRSALLAIGTEATAALSGATRVEGGRRRGAVLVGGGIAALVAVGALLVAVSGDGGPTGGAPPVTPVSVAPSGAPAPVPVVSGGTGSVPSPARSAGVGPSPSAVPSPTAAPSAEPSASAGPSASPTAQPPTGEPSAGPEPTEPPRTPDGSPVPVAGTPSPVG
ncbi:protein kinase domain-containing protein [Longispora urticae]